MAKNYEALTRTLLYKTSAVLGRLVLRLPAPVRQLFVYSATVVRWIDGDTVWLKVDLGFRFSAELDFRLTGINTPERGKPGWAEATARAQQLAPANSPVTIQSRKAPDKYGRYLADIWNYNGQHVNQVLVEEGHAVAFMVNT